MEVVLTLYVVSTIVCVTDRPYSRDTQHSILASVCMHTMECAFMNIV